MELKDYPYTRCLNPKRIYNPYLKDWLIVPCGHCRACQISKGSRYKLQIQLEAKQHKYCVFGTLTYTNSTIPRLTLVPHHDSLLGVVNGYEMVDKQTGEYMGILDSPSYDVEPLLDKLHLFGDVPYLRKHDLQLFFKRLRKNLSYYGEEKIRYFACGEYGPVHFRPHYHFLLFFDADTFTASSGHTLSEFPSYTWYDPDGKALSTDVLSVLEFCIRKAWPYGRCDAQYSQGDAARYVASYVSGAGTLPKVYQMASTRSFSCHSRFLGQGFLACESKKIYETPVRDFIKRSTILNGSNKEFDLWRSCYSVWYPKCKGYAGKSSSQRMYTYQLYDTCRRLFPYCKTILEISREIVMYLTFYAYGKQHTLTELDSSNRRLLTYFRDSLNYKGNYLEYGLDDITLDRMVYNVYHELLISRHFLEFCCRTAEMPPRSMLRRIEDFYSDLDMMHLNDFYQAQSVYFVQDFVDENDIVYMYNNTRFSIDSFKQSETYRSFEQTTFEIWRNRIKHKQLNDANQLFIDK